MRIGEARIGTPVNEAALDTIWRDAHTHRKWLPEPVANAQLVALYDLMKWGPTSHNSFPARIVFVTTPEAKARLVPLLWEGNRPKVAGAPVIAIIGYDTRFYEWMPRLFPQRDMRSTFSGDSRLAEETAFRNGSLQGGYLILAARAVGLDCGPMSGFDNDAVDREFFPGGRVKSNFVCSIGHGDPGALRGRLPRPDFAEACSIV